MPDQAKKEKPKGKKKAKTVTYRVGIKPGLKSKRPTALGIVRGKGDFFSDVFNTGKKLLGQGLHKGVDWLSSRAKDAIKNVISGHGDYVLPGVPVENNSLYSAALVAPKFEGKSGSHGTIIQHRESLGVLKSSTGFARTSVNINPGLSTFPWLSNVAPGWQRWKLHGAIIEWIPRVSPISTDASGSVVLSTRYDLTTAAPASIQEAESAFGAVVGRPMDPMAMPIECKQSMVPTNVLNVRFGSLPAGGNLQFFDHCIVDVATYGQATATTNIGELFITYEVEFQMPTAEHLSNSTIDCYAGYSAVTTAAPYGSTGSWASNVNSTLPVTITAGPTSVSMVFDTLRPLPVGSTWSVNLAVDLGATNITTNSAMLIGADFQLYLVLKGSAGTSIGSFQSYVPGTSEVVLAYLKVVGQTGAQSVIFNGAVFAAASSGYANLTVTPMVSGLAEVRMRNRYPELYKLQDMLDRIQDLTKDVEEKHSYVEACPPPLARKLTDIEDVPSPCGGRAMIVGLPMLNTRQLQFRP